MPKIKEIINLIESLAHPSLQEVYDNSGIQCGNPEAETESAMFCLDCTEDVVEEAIGNKCSLIIAHHPVIFGKGLKRLTGASHVERVIARAIRHDITIYCVHTNLDNISHGVNKALADALGLRNCRILSPREGDLMKLVTFIPVKDADKVREAVAEAGAGSIGNYSECSFNVTGTGTFRPLEGSNAYVGEKGKLHREQEVRLETVFPKFRKAAVVNALVMSHPYEEVAYDLYQLSNDHGTTGAGMIGELETPLGAMDFLGYISSRLDVRVMRHSPLISKQIGMIAICGGSGSFLIPEAIKKGADAFITGDLKYHQFFDSEGRILLVDAGHYETEQFVPSMLGSLLTKYFPNFALHFPEKNLNPVNYFTR